VARPRAPQALDANDRKLVEALSRDGRRSAARLAQELGVSRQAVTQRLRDLERRGVIRGFRAEIDPGALGLSVQADLRLTLDPSAAPRAEKLLIRRLTADARVRSVHRVSGEDCIVARVVARRIEDVTEILAALRSTRALAGSRTCFVLETLVEKGGLGSAEGLVEEVP